MSVLKNRHTFSVLCELGDGDLVSPSYPGASTRLDMVYATAGSVIGYGNYPSTTPDNIVKLIRDETDNLPGSYIRIVTGPCGYLGNATVTAGFPPSPIAGSPFSTDERTGTPYASIHPRWTGEATWDLNAFPATEAITAQGLVQVMAFSYGYPGIADPARFGVSFDTGVLANDPSDGGDSTFDQEAEYKVFAQSNSVCCWNEGVELELNLDVWKIDFTATAVAGSPGVFTFTLGSASFHSTLTQTVTVDPSWESASNVLIHTFTIPKVTGSFTFVNDFYVSSVTAP